MKMKLVVCDLDGTITRRDNVWMEIHRALGTQDAAKECFRTYMNGGYRSYKEWAKAEASLWRGETRDTLMDIVRDIPTYPGVSELVSGFKDMGIKVVILSSGLTILADHIKDLHGFHDALANELVFDRDGRVTGQVNPWVPFAEKDRVLIDYLGKNDIHPSDCLALGDGENDIPVFKVCGQSIAFNPNGNLTGHADTVVRGEDLRLVIEEFHRLCRD